jgi:hypothetical protein
MKLFVAPVLLAAAGLLLASCMSAPAPAMEDKGMAAAGMEEPAPMMEEVVYKGYLLDQACAKLGKGMDGSAVLTMPGDHSQECLVACEASGFGVMVQDGMGYRYIPFDAAGSRLAFRTVVQTTKKPTDIGAEVKGTLKDGVLVLSSIREIDLMM